MPSTLRSEKPSVKVHIASAKAIRDLSARIAELFQPKKILLFGSHAYGATREFSDVDMLVVLRFKGNPVRKAIEILKAVAPEFAVDLIVMTPAQLKQRLAWNDFFLQEVTHKGRILYEAPDA